MRESQQLQQPPSILSIGQMKRMLTEWGIDIDHDTDIQETYTQQAAMRDSNSNRISDSQKSMNYLNSTSTANLGNAKQDIRTQPISTRFFANKSRNKAAQSLSNQPDNLIKPKTDRSDAENTRENRFSSARIHGSTNSSAQQERQSPGISWYSGGVRNSIETHQGGRVSGGQQSHQRQSQQSSQQFADQNNGNAPRQGSYSPGIFGRYDGLFNSNTHYGSRFQARNHSEEQLRYKGSGKQSCMSLLETARKLSIQRQLQKTQPNLYKASYNNISQTSEFNISSNTNSAIKNTFKTANSLQSKSSAAGTTATSGRSPSNASFPSSIISYYHNILLSISFKKQQISYGFLNLKYKTNNFLHNLHGIHLVLAVLAFLLFYQIFALITQQGSFRSFQPWSSSSYPQPSSSLSFCDSTMTKEMLERTNNPGKCLPCPQNALCLNGIIKCNPSFVLLDRRCIPNPQIEPNAIKYIRTAQKTLRDIQAHFICYEEPPQQQQQYQQQQRHKLGNDGISLKYHTWNQIQQILLETHGGDHLYYETITKVKDYLSSKSIREQFGLMYDSLEQMYYVDQFDLSQYCKQQNILILFICDYSVINYYDLLFGENIDSSLYRFRLYVLENQQIIITTAVLISLMYVMLKLPSLKRFLSQYEIFRSSTKAIKQDKLAQLQQQQQQQLQRMQLQDRQGQQQHPQEDKYQQQQQLQLSYAQQQQQQQQTQQLPFNYPIPQQMSLQQRRISNQSSASSKDSFFEESEKRYSQGLFNHMNSYLTTNTRYGIVS